MKITIYLSDGQTEYTSNKTLQEIINEIWERKKNRTFM